MATIEDVLSDLEKQRRSWNEFKVVQEARLGNAEKTIRAMFISPGQQNFGAPRNNLKRLKGCASC